MPLSEAQQWALVIAPKVTGLISLLFSGLVIITVLICPEKRTKTYHRLLLGISFVDASSSFWLGLSTWPIPEETGILLASGSTTTCTIQGFCTQFGISSSFYNASLSLFYLLVIRYSWKEHEIIKLEPWLHGIPIMWGLGTATAGVPLTIFNSANLWCWIAEYGERGANADLFRWVFFYVPLWLMILFVTVNVMLIFHFVRTLERATERYQQSHTQSSIVAVRNPMKRRGNNYQIQYASDLGTADETCRVEDRHLDNELIEEDDWDGNGDEKEEEGENTKHDAKSSLNESGECETNKTSTHMYRTTLKKPLSSILSFRGASASTNRKRRMQRSREVANQSLRFAGSFYFTWIALTLTRLLQAINGKTYFPLLLIAAITTPLQGLPNFLVYLYPRYKKAKKKRPEAGAMSLLLDSIRPEKSRPHTIGRNTSGGHNSGWNG